MYSHNELGYFYRRYRFLNIIFDESVDFVVKYYQKVGYGLLYILVVILCSSYASIYCHRIAIGVQDKYDTMLMIALMALLTATSPFYFYRISLNVDMAIMTIFINGGIMSLLCRKLYKESK